jgi:hypothetical protein
MKPADRPRLQQAAAVGVATIALTLALAVGAMTSAHAAATIVIVNQNAPGEGFNDPTPAVPVGGNTGTTLGQQRLIAFQRAADIWGATLTSSVPMRIGASFQPLSCTANSAVLGSAGANEIWSDFTNAPRAGTWYPSALASKLAGEDVATPGEPHIIARFNSRLGLFPDCLPGNPASTSAWTAISATRSTSSPCCCTNSRTAWASRPSPTTRPAPRSRTSPRSGTTTC